MHLFKHIQPRIRTLLVIILILCVLIFLWVYISFQISKSRTFQFFGGLTSRVETEEKVVALTFDDAPSPHVSEVLRILEEKNVPGTFYEIGENIEKYPTEARAIVEADMEVGNHSYSHQRFLLKSQSFIQEEIQKTNELIRESGYSGEITFRPPNGKKLIGLPRYLKQQNMKTVMWDVEPDTYYSDKDNIVQHVIDHTRPGSIILMHPFCDSCTADREALPIIIDKLKEQGYTFLKVADLLKNK